MSGKTRQTRIGLGLVFLGLLFFLFWFDGWFSQRLTENPDRWYEDGWLFALVWGALVCLACWEFLTIAENLTGRLPRRFYLAIIFLIITERYWFTLIGLPRTSLAHVGILLMMALYLGGIWQGLRHGIVNVLQRVGVMCLAVIYMGLGGWFVVKIRQLGPTLAPDNFFGAATVVLTFILTVKSADIGAYLIGSWIGKHPWVPSISPAKTWEGFIGGVVLAMIVSSLLCLAFGIMGLGSALLFGLGMGVCGQFGDLLESMFKRDAGVKDSARMIPAFGGMLDLLDSLLVASPFAFLFLKACEGSVG